MFFTSLEKTAKLAEIAVTVGSFLNYSQSFDRIEQFHFFANTSTSVEQEYVQNMRAPQPVDAVKDMLLPRRIFSSHTFFLPLKEGEQYFQGGM